MKVAEQGTSKAATLTDPVTEMIDAFNAHDPERVAAVCTEDVVWEDPMVPARLVGREAVTGYARMQFRAFPDLEMTVEEVYPAEDENKAVVRWRLTATMTGPLDPPGFLPTGEAVAIDGVTLYRFEGHKVACKTIVYDGLDLARQIGALPSGDLLAVWMQRLSVWTARVRLLATRA